MKEIDKLEMELRELEIGFTNNLTDLNPSIDQEVASSANTIPSSRLKWAGATEEQVQFMRKVYDINVQKAKSMGRKFVSDIPAQELDMIEGKQKGRKEMAENCRRLLVAARQAILSEKVNVKVGVVSAYRSASEQFSLWQSGFISRYYPQTRQKRIEMDGGDHGENATQYLARYISARLATPGYSLHNNGLAIDLSNTQDGISYQINTDKTNTKAWRNSWLWKWLTSNANSFGFYQNEKIDEPWHWEYKLTNFEVKDKPNQKAKSLQNTSGKNNTNISTTLLVDKINYISFEGGGGKGYAYLGAIKALEQHFDFFPLTKLESRRKRVIEGLSGSSAGAITALFLGLGYSFEEIKDFWSNKKEEDFFDEPKVKESVGLTDNSGFLENFFKKNNPIIKMTPDLNAKSFFSSNLMKGIIGRVGPPLILDYLKKENPFLAEKLSKNIKDYYASLIKTFGIFSGDKIYKIFREIVVKKTGNEYYTFRDHYKEFHVKLVIASVNILKQEIHYLSCDTVPDLPLALAVRMSMNLMLVFEPIRITNANKFVKESFRGLWVDGGFFDNTPIRTFPPANTLLFRVWGGPETKIINTFGDFLKAWLIDLGVYGSGSGQVTTSTFPNYLSNVIHLNTNKTSTYKFHMEKKDLDDLIMINELLTSQQLTLNPLNFNK